MRSPRSPRTWTALLLLSGPAAVLLWLGIMAVCRPEGFTAPASPPWPVPWSD